MRVLALVPYPLNRVPGQRFRLEQWAPLLRQDGIEMDFSPFLKPAAMSVLYKPGHTVTKVSSLVRGYAMRAAEALFPGDYDVALVHRWATFFGPAWFEPWISRRIPLVYDFDDAIYRPWSSRANAWASIFKPAGKTAAICRVARHVMVGNDYLAAYARPLSANLTVVPTTIDTQAYFPRERPPNTRPVVGWTGSVTTIPYLEAIGGALGRLARGGNCEIRVIGGELRIPDGEVRCQPWNAQTEIEDIRAFDIGLMPMPDDEWARGKCALKALQYMALGIPPVVTPVGVNAEVVTDGVNGFHARTEDEWVEKVERLASDPELRRRLGAAARRTVEERFSAAAQAPVVARILKAVKVP
jgi:glycosyltransferase involved in cell wall biosynthesis